MRQFDRRFVYVFAFVFSEQQVMALVVCAFRYFRLHFPAYSTLTFVQMNLTLMFHESFNNLVK